jgi:hypothetical protein
LRIAIPHCLPLDIKDSLKEDLLLLWGFLLWGFLLWGFLLEAFIFDFWSFGFLMWEALEGKRIAERALLK